MQLEELVTGNVQWEISVEEHKFNLELRPFNLEDESWLRRNWNEKDLQEVFAKVKSSELVRIAYRQLTLQSKKDLSNISIVDMNEEGREITKKITPLEALNYSIKNHNDLNELLRVIVETRGLSLPLLLKIAEKVDLSDL